MKTLRPSLAALLTLGLFLSACASAGSTDPQATTSPTQARSVTLTASSTPGTPSLPPPTLTPLPCDPSNVEYCIVTGTFVLARPIASPGMQSVDRTYAYGSTAEGLRDPHHGVEFSNGSGTPVLAAAAGTVFHAGDDSDSRFSPWSNFYGSLVILEHILPAGTLFTLYAHLSMIDVVRGQSVTAGQKIGEVGLSGSAIGSHLHFEVRLEPLEYDSTLNPELWLLPLPGTGVLALRFVDPEGDFCQTFPNVQYYGSTDNLLSQAWPEVYPPALTAAKNWENALLGSLSPGEYRISLMWRGVLFERRVQVQSGLLTLVEFVLP